MLRVPAFPVKRGIPSLSSTPMPNTVCLAPPSEEQNAKNKKAAKYPIRLLSTNRKRKNPCNQPDPKNSRTSFPAKREARISLSQPTRHSPIASAATWRLHAAQSRIANLVCARRAPPATQGPGKGRVRIARKKEKARPPTWETGLRGYAAGRNLFRYSASGLYPPRERK
ncbi:MAG: hypothetical protein RLY31_349 [Bacteroidota bacterium]